MMINDENKKSLSKMLKSRTLYIALGVCLLAAGAVGFNSVNRIHTDPAVEPSSVERVTYKNVSDPIFHENIPDIGSSESFSEKPAAESPAPVISDEAEQKTEAVFDNDSPTLTESPTEAPSPVCFVLPVFGSLSRDYSMGTPVFSTTMSDYRTHNGIDLAAEAGQQVKTVASGNVTAVLSDSVWGNTVEVDHGQGYVSRISGLADAGLITEGSTLAADAVIGVIGTIPVEEKDPPHIHLEMRLNGELIDPLEALGLTDTDD